MNKNDAFLIAGGVVCVVIAIGLMVTFKTRCPDGYYGYQQYKWSKIVCIKE